MDAVSDRDFLLDLTYACAVSMMHLSRLCEELILWSSEEFGFVSDGRHVLDRLVASCRRRRTRTSPSSSGARPDGSSATAVALLTVLKGLPLAYNKDMQEDKEAAFDAIDTLQATLWSSSTACSHRCT